MTGKLIRSQSEGYRIIYPFRLKDMNVGILTRRSIQFYIMLQVFAFGHFYFILSFVPNKPQGISISHQYFISKAFNADNITFF